MAGDNLRELDQIPANYEPPVYAEIVEDIPPVVQQVIKSSAVESSQPVILDSPDDEVPDGFFDN
jgi:hypothetical protein